VLDFLQALEDGVHIGDFISAGDGFTCADDEAALPIGAGLITRLAEVFWCVSSGVVYGRE